MSAGIVVVLNCKRSRRGQNGDGEKRKDLLFHSIGFRQNNKKVATLQAVRIIQVYQKKQ
jgi:hypothetical protein